MDFGLKQVNTPCAGAMAFARWLRDTYRNPDAPLASVRMLLAPSEGERADTEIDAVALSAPAPTRSHVEEAMFAWQNECKGDPEGVAILYISGHGIQTGRDAAIVLLADFAATPNVMTNAVDIGIVRHGMVGSDMPQQQYFFVDACRIAPSDLQGWENVGDPLGLSSQFKGSDLRNSPIFFSSSPNTAAIALKGRGTLYSQALLDALSGPAAEDGPDDEGRWHITPFSLQKSISTRVAQLAATLYRHQEAVLGGIPKATAFHYFDTPPAVSFTLEINPEDAHPVAVADLWDDERNAAEFRDERFQTKQLQRRVPAGLYSLDVRIHPPTAPYRDRNGLPCRLSPQKEFVRIIKVL